MIDIFRFCICYNLFYFFLDKASGLIQDRKQVLWYLECFYKFCLAVLFISTIVREFIYEKYSKDDDKVSTANIIIALIIFKGLPVSMVVVQLLVIRKINKPIINQSTNSIYHQVI